MKQLNTTRQDNQKITMQETTGIMETSSDKETQEGRTSKDFGQEERQVKERPTPEKIDSRKVQLNWADQEQETPMDIALNTTERQSTEEGQGK